MDQPAEAARVEVKAGPGQMKPAVQDGDGVLPRWALLDDGGEEFVHCGAQHRDITGDDLVGFPLRHEPSLGCGEHSRPHAPVQIGGAVQEVVLRELGGVVVDGVDKVDRGCASDESDVRNVMSHSATVPHQLAEGSNHSPRRYRSHVLAAGSSATTTAECLPTVRRWLRSTA